MTSDTNDRRTDDKVSSDNGVKLDDIAVDFQSFDKRLAKLEESVALNNEMTSLMLELFKAAKTGFKVMGWVGEVIKWAGMVGGGAVGIYAAWKSLGGK